MACIKFPIKLIDGKPVDPTSSLNDYYMCICGRKYASKGAIIKHLMICVASNPVVCRWCKLQFRNRGNLIRHAFHMHGEKGFKTNQEPKIKKKRVYKCAVCDYTFTERCNLKFHIRRQHFNLWARLPHADVMHINQIWFERVLNTNLFVEIKKISLNTLKMRAIPPNAGIKIHERKKIIDLRSMYPTEYRLDNELCTICMKLMQRKHLKKHMNELHFNVEKHKCNNCNKSFKRSYLYLKHVCRINKRHRRTIVSPQQFLC